MKIRRRTLLAGAGVTAGAACAAALVGGHPLAPSSPASSIAAPVTGTLPPADLPPLRRGINLTHWFEYEQAQGVPAPELAAIRAHGFDHVRIPVDPVVGGWQPQEMRPDAGAPRAATPAAVLPWLWPVRAAIESAIGAGLDVVFDLHFTPATKAVIEGQGGLEASVVALWSDIGAALADLPRTRLAFELYNEPQYYGYSGRRWPALQARMLAALRAHAPAHLVLLSGAQGGSLQALQALPLAADAAVAYVFHTYEPFLFTHQGVYWLDPQYTTAGLRSNLFYPASAQGSNVPGLSQPHPNAERELADYLVGDATHLPKGSPERVRADIDVAGALARQLGIRLVCTEFGAIRPNVDAASRWRLLADVRSALEANGLGWTVWDYTDIFGITTLAQATRRARGLRTIEPAALQALGMAAALPAQTGTGADGTGAGGTATALGARPARP